VPDKKLKQIATYYSQLAKGIVQKYPALFANILKDRLVIVFFLNLEKN